MANDINKDKFKGLLQTTIEVTINKIVSQKTSENKALNYIDSKTISLTIRNLFNKELSYVPDEIETVCCLTEAILSPSLKIKIELLKKAVGVGGGLAGISAIITGIAGALGWGASVITSFTTFFTGVALAGPLAWVLGGVGIATIAGYFALSNDEYKNDEKYRKALKEALNSAIDNIWDREKDKLIKIEVIKS